MNDKAKRMRAGNVVTHRVNPKDCMSVVDVVKQAGVYTPGMSFAAMVSMTLSSVLQTLRDQGIIPERDGFEYLEIVGPHISKQDGRKLEISKTISGIGSRVKVAGLSRPKVETVAPAPAPVRKEVEVTMDVREARNRLTELCQKKDMAEEGVDGVVWGTSDQAEYDSLIPIVYPE